MGSFSEKDNFIARRTIIREFTLIIPVINERLNLLLQCVTNEKKKI